MTGPTIPMSIFFITFGLTVYYLLKSRHIERMARIEHGMAEDMNLHSGALILNLGLFLSFLGLGLLLAFGCAYYFGTREYIFVPAFLMLFGGMGLLAAYTFQLKRNK